MAWMISAGKAERKGGAVVALSIVSTPESGSVGWRLFSAHRATLTAHPDRPPAAAERAWQGVLADLTDY